MSGVDEAAYTAAAYEVVRDINRSLGTRFSVSVLGSGDLPSWKGANGWTYEVPPRLRIQEPETGEKCEIFIEDGATREDGWRERLETAIKEGVDRMSEKKKVEFKVGDRVLHKEYGLGKGTIILRKRFPHHECYGVRFDSPRVCLHDLDGRCESNRGWWVSVDEAYKLTRLDEEGSKKRHIALLHKRIRELEAELEIARKYAAKRPGEQKSKRVYTLPQISMANEIIGSLITDDSESWTFEFSKNNRIVRVIRGGKTGRATCSDSDTYNRSVGLMIAMLRAVGREKEIPKWVYGTKVDGVS